MPKGAFRVESAFFVGNDGEVGEKSVYILQMFE